MLASRVLPPIVRSATPLPPTPVATFFNVPRRYVKSNMQVGDNYPPSTMDDTKPSRNLRKSSRIHDSQVASTSNPAERSKQEDPPSPALTSPRTTRKRLASVVEVVDEDTPPDNSSPIDVPTSATSTGSPDFTAHVCLCQPEPKIPRPRNGESYIPLSLISSDPNRQCKLGLDKEMYSLFADVSIRC